MIKDLCDVGRRVVRKIQNIIGIKNCQVRTFLCVEDFYPKFVWCPLKYHKTKLQLELKWKIRNTSGFVRKSIKLNDC